MKMRIINTIFMAGVLSLIISSCTEDDNSTDDQTQKQVEQNVQSGMWIITYFEDSGKDETSDFNGYEFTFGTNGVLTASNGTTTYTGTWSVTDSSSDDDSPDDDMDFNIFFNLSNEFEDLNDDWDIVSQTASKIELIDVSGGNGGTDYLTFEKK